MTTHTLSLQPSFDPAAPAADAVRPFAAAREGEEPSLLGQLPRSVPLGVWVAVAVVLAPAVLLGAALWPLLDSR